MGIFHFFEEILHLCNALFALFAFQYFFLFAGTLFVGVHFVTFRIMYENLPVETRSAGDALDQNGEMCR